MREKSCPIGAYAKGIDGIPHSGFTQLSRSSRARSPSPGTFASQVRNQQGAKPGLPYRDAGHQQDHARSSKSSPLAV